MSDLVLFLMEHLPEEEWEQLDEHREKQFDYEYVPEGRADLWTAQAPGCAVCTQNPSKHGGIGYGTSWIEAWPCRHLCALALPYADQPGYHPWWQERLTLGAQVIWRGTNS